MQLKSTWVVIFLLATLFVNGQALYSRAFGNSQDKPILFLHGGPGYNCANFEVTTAKELASHGFYVIVYDRRGEGRSKDPNASFTFSETFDDLLAIYQQYGITKASLIGHSFGGIVATLFAKAYPGFVNTVFLVGAPVSLQATFKTILSTSKAIYQSKNDSVNLHYLSLLENMDTTSIAYSSYAFQHAMQNGFYTPKKPTAEAIALYALFGTDTILQKHASQMTYPAPQGFWKKEHYTTIDLTTTIGELQKMNISIYGLYGKDDGLYAPSQIEALQQQVGADHVLYFDNCSHSVFIDQQTAFIEAVKKWTH